MKKGSQRLAKLLLSFLAILVLIGVVARFMPGVLREGFWQQKEVPCKNDNNCSEIEKCLPKSNKDQNKVCKKITCGNLLSEKFHTIKNRTCVMNKKCSPFLKITGCDNNQSCDYFVSNQTYYCRNK